MSKARYVCAFVFLLTLFSLTFLAFEALAQSAMTLTAEDVTAGPQDIVPVSVTASQVQSDSHVVSIQGRFGFDPSVFVVTDFTFNNAFDVTSVNVQNDQGLVRFVATLIMDSDGPIVGLGDTTLFTFNAQAVGSPGDVSPIDVTFDLVKNMDHKHLVVTVVDGSFTISGANLPPIADFSFDPPTPQVGQKLNFTDASTDPDGFIVQWDWDFGDGGTLTIQTPSEPVMHTYTQGGSYNVTLTVTDNRGATGSTTKTLRVGPKHGEPKIYVFPNPCRSTCNFYYEFPPETTAIDLRIFNIRGELVYSTGLDVGANIFRWNMRDDFGRPVPNGPYFFIGTFSTGQGIIRSPVGAFVISR